MPHFHWLASFWLVNNAGLGAWGASIFDTLYANGPSIVILSLPLQAKSLKGLANQHRVWQDLSLSVYDMLHLLFLSANIKTRGLASLKTVMCRTGGTYMLTLSANVPYLRLLKAV